jgi:hypothetical protein
MRGARSSTNQRHTAHHDANRCAMVLLVEASHDDALRAALAAGRTAMERAIMPTLIALGAPELGH